MTTLHRRLAAAALAAAASAVLLTGCASGHDQAEGKGAAAEVQGHGKPSASPTPAKPKAPALSAAQQAQVDYALKYWKNYNTAVYGDYNPEGGDCANFVSQTLIARGWTQNSEWNNDAGKASAAWSYVPAMDNYFIANQAQLGLQLLGEDDRSKYAVGDIVVFSWEGVPGATDDRDHVEVIDRITHEADGSYKIELASHNNDGAYRDLDHQITVEHPGGTFHVWHLTKDTNS